jgi:uncharacterized membrane protein YphA (DoxX/SURF4 family)
LHWKSAPESPSWSAGRHASAGFLLAGFSVLGALIFHADFGDQMQSILFMKNLAMAGGLLLLVANGAGDWSVDARQRRTSGGLQHA